MKIGRCFKYLHCNSVLLEEFFSTCKQYYLIVVILVLHQLKVWTVRSTTHTWRSCFWSCKTEGYDLISFHVYIVYLKLSPPTDPTASSRVLTASSTPSPNQTISSLDFSILRWTKFCSLVPFRSMINTCSCVTRTLRSGLFMSRLLSSIGCLCCLLLRLRG